MDHTEATAMASRKRIVICYILLQSSFWGMLSSICAYQAAVVLDRGFTAGQAGIFCRSSAAGPTGTRRCRSSGC